MNHADKASIEANDHSMRAMLDAMGVDMDDPSSPEMWDALGEMEAEKRAVSIELTYLEKSKGPLSKRIFLDPTSKMVSDGSPCKMSKGTAGRLILTGKDHNAQADDFARVLTKMPSNTAIATGRLVDGLPDVVQVVTKKQLVKNPGAITRTGQYIQYKRGAPALVLIDVDYKGMPQSVRDNLESMGGVEGALQHLMPEYATTTRIIRSSTSSNIVNIATGQAMPASGGKHIYLVVEDGTDAERFLRTLHERLWAVGLGWHMIGKAGQLLDRSLADRMVFSPERLVFEGAPTVVPPLKQSERMPEVHHGEILDTRAACPSLTEDEDDAVMALKRESGAALKLECEAQAERFEVEHATKLAEREGIDFKVARGIISRMRKGVLYPQIVLLWDDEDYAGCTVGDVLKDPKRFKDLTMADPIEGIEYGTGKAKLLLRPDGTPWIRSFAHGLTEYTLSDGKEREPSDDDGEGPFEDPGYSASVDAEAAARNSQVEAVVAELNKKHMFVVDEGKAVIITPKIEHTEKRWKYPVSTMADFRATYMNQLVLVAVKENGEEVYATKADVWLRHENRRQYLGGVKFDPTNKQDTDTLNLWRGWAYEPKQGSWQLMQDHLLNVLCSGNTEYRDYLMGWMASLVQKPAERGHVSVVMKGDEGTGKGTLANALCEMIGQHSYYANNAKHLVGNFNSHLQGCVFLFADEAFFAGDKAHVGALKSLITEEKLSIEAKYKNAVNDRNFLHIMMASNNDWVVPASLEARRFFVLNVPNTHRQDIPYFKAIDAEMRNGGYEAMLYDLLNYNLSGYNVRDIPETEGLQDQKKLSMNTENSWWLDCLQRGYVFKSKHGLERYFGEWQTVLTTDVLVASYQEYARAHGERRPLSRERFGVFMRGVGCTPSHPRNAVVGEHIVDVPNAWGGTTRKAELVTKERATGYSVGVLDIARKNFEGATKLPFVWPEQDVPTEDVKVPDFAEMPEF